MWPVVSFRSGSRPQEPCVLPLVTCLWPTFPARLRSTVLGQWGDGVHGGLLLVLWARRGVAPPPPPRLQEGTLALSWLKCNSRTTRDPISRCGIWLSSPHSWLCSHLHYLIVENFCVSKKRPTPISNQAPLPRPPCPGNQQSCLSLWGCLFWALRINGIRQSVACGVVFFHTASCPQGSLTL